MIPVVVESLAEPVGRHWLAAHTARLATGGRFLVAAPLSGTPLPVFDWIVEHADRFQDWWRVSFVLMDEQLDGHGPFEYVSLGDPASYERFARQHLLDRIKDRVGVRIPIVKPEAGAIDTFDSGIDLLILAIGVRGNFANVMPGTSKSTGWHVAHLMTEFRHVHTAPESRSYAGATFREYGMSLGPEQVLAARDVVVIASVERKRALVRELLSTTAFVPEFPLSVVHERSLDATTIYVTQDALP